MIFLICRIKHFPFLASGHTKSITIFEPFQITANVMDASERSISIPSVDAEDLFGFFYNLLLTRQSRKQHEFGLFPV